MNPDACRLPAAARTTQIRCSDLTPGLLHVVIFGPGEGEAALLVFPDGTLGIVDGCREPRGADGQGDPVHEFLAALPAPRRIRFVCLTHPHDDHYGGLGALIDANRDYIDELWTLPLHHDRFRSALLRSTELLFPAETPDGPSKYSALQRLVGEVVTAARLARPGVRQLAAGTEMLVERSMASARLRITACGPAQQDLALLSLRSEEYLSCLLNENPLSPELDPNRTSGALRVQWGKTGVLLTGDLLTGNYGSASGWCGFADALMGDEDPIHLWNAAHHGSAEAHHDALWRHHQAPLVIVTPFKRASGSQPPRPEQIALLAQTACVIITSEPAWLAEKDPRYPRRLVPSASTGTTGVRSRSGGLSHVSAPTPRDIDNAVAVSLDAMGTIVSILLSGKADFYVTDPLSSSR